MNKLFAAVVVVFLLTSLLSENSDALWWRKPPKIHVQVNANRARVQAPLVKRDINQADLLSDKDQESDKGGYGSLFH